MKERRRHKRLNKALDVKYTCAKGPLIIEATTKSKDISAGGMCLALDDNLKIADRVKLAIALPWRSHPLEAMARVVWASPRPITGAAGIERNCGLEFSWFPHIDEVMRHITQ
jgi:c-di-GMP-binding flagellar brake protein YcgR